MRFPILLQVLRHLLLVILCLSSLWFVTPCLGTSGNSDSREVLCLSGNKHPRLRRQNDNFSVRAVAETAQARAFLSPAVFLGTLRSVLVQRDGTVRAWFAIDSPLKMDNSTKGSSKDIEVVYFWNSEDQCNLEVNQDNLKLGSQYLVFGVPYRETPWPSLTASALPIPNEKRTLRAVKKVLCKGCAKAPGIAGLEKARVEQGGRVRLNCHLTGNPIPWVEWYKDGTKIISRGRLRVKTKRRTSRLVIRKARLSDRGRYECRAGNVIQPETVSATATVIVTRKKSTKEPLTTTRPIPTLTSTQSSPWTTEPCHTTDFCLNGGTCIFYKDVREYVCHCAEGYVGLRCDYKDVRVSLGEVKNLNTNHDRLFIAIVILFLIFFCLNWACIGICWLCCFRSQQSSWGKIREMAPLRRFFKNEKLPNKDPVSANVAMELSSRRSSSDNDAENKRLNMTSLNFEDRETEKDDWRGSVHSDVAT